MREVPDFNKMVGEVFSLLSFLPLTVKHDYLGNLHMSKYIFVIEAWSNKH